WSSSSLHPRCTARMPTTASGACGRRWRRGRTSSSTTSRRNGKRGVKD
ncbi:MAG: hypothetical protein AVDCRST_MAG68-41, partial [uncultured Gemmatimonadetes bacterium]